MASLSWLTCRFRSICNSLRVNYKNDKDSTSINNNMSFLTLGRVAYFNAKRFMLPVDLTKTKMTPFSHNVNWAQHIVRRYISFPSRSSLYVQLILCMS